MEIEFRDIVVRDGRKDLTDPLTFSVREGATTALLGPSRTGKSTLLLYASGHAHPEQGTVWIVDEDSQVRPSWHYVGLGPIGEFAPLFDTLTVLEHLRFHVQLHRQKHPKKRVETLLEQFQLQDIKKERVKDVNRFDYARLSLAIAVAHQPPFIMLDEPEAGLTESEWSEIKRYLKQLNGLRTGILYTTVLAWATDAAHQVVELPSGEVTSKWPLSPSSESNGDAFGAIN